VPLIGNHKYSLTISAHDEVGEATEVALLRSQNEAAAILEAAEPPLRWIELGEVLKRPRCDLERLDDFGYRLGHKSRSAAMHQKGADTGAAACEKLTTTDHDVHNPNVPFAAGAGNPLRGKRGICMSEINGNGVAPAS
jgi:hypothetical protein